MKKQLILLAGLHKTGTSSIQETCRRRRTLLADAGVTYPELWVDRGQQGTRVEWNHTFLLRNMFMKHRELRQWTRNDGIDLPQDNEDLNRRARAALHAAIERDNPDTILMIAEAVSIFSREELLVLRRWFDRRSFGIRLFCCIRSPWSWLNSMIDQAVAGMRGPRLTIRAAIERTLENSGTVRPRILNIMNVFPDAAFYGFKPAVSHPAGPVGYFFDKAGIKIMEEVKPVRANEGRGAHSVRINSLINEEIGSQYKRMDPRYLELVEKVVPTLNSVKGTRFALRRVELAGLLPVLEEENLWLNDNFGEEFCDDRIELNDDLPSLDERTRRRLQAIAAAAEPRVRQLIDRYLATYD